MDGEQRTLAGALSAGRFAVICELLPPRGCDPGFLEQTAGLLHGRCDAMLVTDNAYARVASSSIANAALLVRQGMDCVVGLTCRDRNRIALQADALGAALLGINSLLCLTGDHPSLGNEPDARPVFDLDALQELAMLRTLRDEGLLLGGEPLTGPAPRYLLGAAAHLAGPIPAVQLARVGRKVRAGAQFLVTQTQFDLPAIEQAVARYRAAGLHHQAGLLIAVAPPTPELATLILAGGIPGTTLSSEVAARLTRAGDWLAESVRICAELVAALPHIPEVRGVYIGAPGGAPLQAAIVEQAGIDAYTRATRSPDDEGTARELPGEHTTPRQEEWVSRAARCPKGMHDGPCGGATPLGDCEVAGLGRCAWME